MRELRLPEDMGARPAPSTGKDSHHDASWLADASHSHASQARFDDSPALALDDVRVGGCAMVVVASPHVWLCVCLCVKVDRPFRVRPLGVGNFRVPAAVTSEFGSRSCVFLCTGHLGLSCVPCPWMCWLSVVQPGRVKHVVLEGALFLGGEVIPGSDFATDRVCAQCLYIAILNRKADTVVSSCGVGRARGSGVCW